MICPKCKNDTLRLKGSILSPEGTECSVCDAPPENSFTITDPSKVVTISAKDIRTGPSPRLEDLRVNGIDVEKLKDSLRRRGVVVEDPENDAELRRMIEGIPPKPSKIVGGVVVTDHMHKTLDRMGILDDMQPKPPEPHPDDATFRPIGEAVNDVMRKLAEAQEDDGA
jgi:hypothetical protein